MGLWTKKLLGICLAILYMESAQCFDLHHLEDFTSIVPKPFNIDLNDEVTEDVDEYAVATVVSIAAKDFSITETNTFSSNEIAEVIANDKSFEINNELVAHNTNSEDQLSIEMPAHSLDERPSETTVQNHSKQEVHSEAVEITFHEKNGTFETLANFIDLKLRDKFRVIVLDQNGRKLENNDGVKIILSDKTIVTHNTDGSFSANGIGETQVFVTNISAVGRVDIRVIGQLGESPASQALSIEGPKLEIPKELIKIKDIGPVKTSVEARLNTNHVIAGREESGVGSVNNEHQIISELDTTSLELVLLEDRSHFSDNAEEGKVYPAVNIKVKILGDNQTYRSSSTGRVLFTSIPMESEIVFIISDDTGYYRQSKVYVSVDEPNKTHSIHLLRSSIFNTYSDIGGVVQRADLSSFCATASTDSIVGAKVSIDAESEGPYYFNEHGFLDITAESLSSNGKFCYFNIETGPTLLTIQLESGEIIPQLYHLAPASHLQQRISIEKFEPMSWSLKSLATAREHFSADDSLYNQLRHVDVIDVYSFGKEEPLSAGGIGKVGYENIHTRPTDWFFVSPQAGEFEMTISRLSEKSDEPIILLPNGFVEDLSYYLAKDYDHALGQVVVVYHSYDNVESERIIFKLKDFSGNSVSEAQYFSAAPMTKAVFFNVNFGSYILTVEDEYGRWLGESVLPVYEQRTTVSTLGKTLN